jgi:hypothetical protein
MLTTWDGSGAKLISSAAEVLPATSKTASVQRLDAQYQVAGGDQQA